MPEQPEIGLTREEREWLDGWAERCDADPALRRHDGYVEMFENILTFRLGRALVEAADALPDLTEGNARVGTSAWSQPARDIYSLAIEEAQSALRARAAAAKGCTCGHPACPDYRPANNGAPDA